MVVVKIMMNELEHLIKVCSVKANHEVFSHLVLRNSSLQFVDEYYVINSRNNANM
jgi:hypothetical protein